MRRVLQQIANGADFHQLPRVHHGDVIGQITHNPEIVSNEENGHAELLTQLAQQLDDLRLDRNVQRRRGFIGHQEFGLGRQSHRDHDALLHSAGQFVRITLHTGFRRWNPHQLQQPQDFSVGG
jgi:hypothetical protein